MPGQRDRFTGIYAVHDRILEPEPWFLSEGRPKSVGGPGKVTAAMVSECLAVMQTYVALCAKTMAAEFPKFDLLTSFEAF